MLWESIIVLIANQFLRQEDGYDTQPPQTPRRTVHHDTTEKGPKEQDHLEAGAKYDPVIKNTQRRGGVTTLYGAKTTKSGRSVVLTDKAKRINHLGYRAC